MRIAKTVAVWFLQIVLGLLFVLLGVMKFRDPSWIRSFARWGYPDGFYMVVGVLEAAGGLGLLVPMLTTPAAALLAVVMVGAALTHLVHGEMQRFAVTLVYLVLIALVGWLRRGSMRWPGAARPTGAEVVV